jgi:hypothetical protein
VISQRRYYLDKLYKDNTEKLKGDVLDIGGKKDNKKGNYKPNSNLKMFYLNNDLTTNPDFNLDANNFHLGVTKKFNFFFLAEVLEHLDNPIQSIISSNHILHKDGMGFISMPFMYRKHNDPKDMQRWTDTKLIKAFNNNGFVVLKIIPMGGLFCVMHDFWMFSILRTSKLNPLSLLNKIFFKIFSPILRFLDLKTKYLEKFITSGWFLIVKKK